MIKINAFDAKAKYERLSRELIDLPHDCERAAEIRNQQRLILCLHHEFERINIDAMAEALKAQHRQIGESEAGKA